MRIVSWNLNSRRSQQHAWPYLESLKPDVALLQEARPLGSPLANWRFVPQEGWRTDEHRRWGPVVGSPHLDLSPVDAVETTYKRDVLFAIEGALTVPGSTAIAEAEVEGIGPITFISLYGLMARIYSQTTLFHLVADLIPLFDSGREHLILGGDFNATAQWLGSIKERKRYEAIFHAFESLGLVECFKATRDGRDPLPDCGCGLEDCFHVETYRHQGKKGSRHGHLDYLFVSTRLSSKIKDCWAVAQRDESVWDMSDHSPVVVDLDL